MHKASKLKKMSTMEFDKNLQLLKIEKEEDHRSPDNLDSNIKPNKI